MVRRTHALCGSSRSGNEKSHYRPFYRRHCGDHRWQCDRIGSGKLSGSRSPCHQGIAGNGKTFCGTAEYCHALRRRSAQPAGRNGRTVWCASASGECCPAESRGYSQYSGKNPLPFPFERTAFLLSWMGGNTGR